MAVLSTHKPWNRRMVNDYDYIDDEEDERDTSPKRRPVGPRFGPFVTIAAAILMLFGVASRIGKPADNGNWLSIDLIASQSLAQERLRLQEQRNTTLVTLGAMPVAPEQLRQQQHAVSLRADNQILPPSRGDVDYQQFRQMQTPPTPLSIPAPTENNQDGSQYERSVSQGGRFDPAPEAPHRAAKPAGKEYVVASGDNWVKIGKATGKKWQDLLNANPQAADGLRVGMKLAIP